MQELKYDLDEESEMRVVVIGGDKMDLKLLSGSAEIYGSRLELQTVHHFKPAIKTIYPIYTWNGCSILVSQPNSPQASTYKVDKNPLPMYLNVHICLENMRRNIKEVKKGPTVMVVGPNSIGKNSLCNILCNYAVREDRKPILVDVDMAQNTLSIPGTIGAAVIDKEMPVSYEDMSTEYSPIIYNYGLLDYEKSPSHYKKLMSGLADNVRKLQNFHSQVKSSGVIINTCGKVRKEGYEMLLQTAFIFEVDVVLVLESEDLYNQFNSHLPFLHVVYLPPPDTENIISSSHDERVKIREHKLRSYFYGSKAFKPYSFKISFRDTKIFKIDGTKFYNISLNCKLKNHLLALSQATKESEISNSPISGYVCVRSIDEESRTLTVMSPQPQPLPKSLFLYTDYVLST